MRKEDIINFFNHCAPSWDAEMIRSDETIRTILDYAEVSEGKDVLDVACGTGVLIPDYLDRNVGSVTAIDIAPEMVKVAKGKFPQENVQIVCGDVESFEFGRKFDCIVVYNAFPHFPEPEHLIKVLASHLKEGGVLTVAHGMSREEIDRRHSGGASKVSRGLMSEDDLAGIFAKYLQVTSKISNENMYLVAGCSERIITVK